jgi:hypothetical protein
LIRILLEYIIGKYFFIVIMTVNNRFFHDIAGEFVVAEIDEVFLDGFQNRVPHFVAAFYDQVLHYVVPELTVAESDCAFKDFGDYWLELSKKLTKMTNKKKKIIIKTIYNINNAKNISNTCIIIDISSITF